MTTQHAERDLAPFADIGDLIIGLPSGETYTFRLSDMDRDKLILNAFRELVTVKDTERQRAIQSKASRETASRYREVFTKHGGHGGVGATVRDRNRALQRFPDSEKADGVAKIQRGRPERYAELVAYLCQSAVRPEDIASNGMLTEEGCGRVACAVFHAARFYLSEMVGPGLKVRSVTDTWFLTWLTLDYLELGTILAAAAYISDDARTDDDLRRALEIMRKPRARSNESEAQAKTRLAAVARNRWRGLRHLGAATQRDFIRFADLRR